MVLHFPAFDRYPTEANLIGRLLAIYGDMEFDLMNCVASVHDLDLALKALFRPRGESARIDVADALARHAYVEAGFETEFSEAIGNFRFCLSVRNQYAHCQWYDSPDIGLGFVDVQKMAESTKHLSLVNLLVCPIDVPLLTQQSDYFGYVQDCLRYLANAYAQHQKRRVTFELSKPARVQQPLRQKPAIRPIRPNPDKPNETPPPLNQAE
jgi:hypothetical protein